MGRRNGAWVLASTELTIHDALSCKRADESLMGIYVQSTSTIYAHDLWRNPHNNGHKRNRRGERGEGERGDNKICNYERKEQGS